MRHVFPARWKTQKLNQLGFVGRGRSRHRPRNEPSLYGGEYPFFQTGDIKAANLYLTEYSQTYNEKGLAQSKQWEPGTLCITIAANIADTAILGIRGCFPDSVIGFISDPAKADVHFIKYYIDLIKLDMQQVSHGTTQDNLSLDKLLRFEFVAPDVEEQRKIAAVLSAYDDLIENNLRRIKILDEMAQNLYREWFVKFRFPGHQQARFIDSSLCPIPEGWEVRELSKFFDFERGVEPGSKNYASKLAENYVPFLRVGDLGKRTSNLFIDKSFAKGRMLAPNDIAITMDGTVGLVSMGLTGAYSSGIRRVVPKTNCTIGNTFVFLLLQSEHIQSIIESHAKGTTIKHASSSIGHMIFVLPDKALTDTFEEHAEPLNSHTLSLGRRNDTLRRTRDLLLPKLISGEVDVSELDIAVPEDATC
ncbi:MAG: restriction endonuclease subunit S [Syntrophaceae bacterium]|nr:restriction endonuclease subunit S [Syntrophaceae bacterium]